MFTKVELKCALICNIKYVPSGFWKIPRSLMLCTHMSQLLWLGLKSTVNGSNGFLNNVWIRRIQYLCNNKKDYVIHCFCCFFYSEPKCFTFEEYNKRTGGWGQKLLHREGDVQGSVLITLLSGSYK